MQFKNLAFFGLASLALAAPDKVRRQDTSASDLSALASVAGVTSLPTNSAVLSSLEGVGASITALLPPSSILSVLETAVPTSVLSELADPAQASSFASAFAAGSTPGWYASLPGNVKTFLSTYAAGVGTSVASGLSSAETAASSIVASASSAASAAGSSASAQASSAGTSSSSTGGAPRATGVFAAGIVGAVGVLGLAVAL